MTSVKLNSGYQMPKIGLGTWKSPPGKVQTAVEYAIDCGYRHIDCAWMYQNENEVGDAIAKKIKEGVVKREDLFITSKLWGTFHQPEHVKRAFLQSLNALKLDYLDLYLVHFPVGYEYVSDAESFPKDEQGNMKFDDIDYMETWKAMEEIHDEKLVRSIGVSNFNEYQCQRLMKNCKVAPAVNQIEVHPYLTQESIIKCCEKLGISVTSYSPLVSGDRPWASKDDPALFEEPVLKEIASKYKKSIAQVAIRFQIDRGLVVIPKSVTPKRIQENMEVFDFKLTDDEISSIVKLNSNFRACHWFHPVHKYNPFQENYSE